MSKLNINQLKKIITEAKLEQKYHNKFIKNWVDVRSPSRRLSEQQLDSMAEHLYELLMEEKS
jgi:hypothetical protein